MLRKPSKSNKRPEKRLNRNPILSRLALSLTALTLCSCASAPPEPLTHWRDYEQVRTSTTEPVGVPAQPKARVIDAGGEGLVCYTPEAADTLADRIEALEANAEAGESYRLALDSMAGELSAVVGAGKVTEDYANHLQAELHRSTEEQGKQSNRHLIERVFLQLLLLGSFL